MEPFPERDPSIAVDGDELKFRLDAAKDAQTRGRLAFAGLTGFSLAFVVALWNAYGSWNRDFVMMSDTSVNGLPKRTQSAHEKLIGEWVSSEFVTIPLVSVKVNVSDAVLIAPIVISVLAIWFVLCLRRENRIIGSLLRETRTADPKERWRIWYSLTSYMVFSLVSDDDKPWTSLDSAKHTYGVRTWLRRAIELLHWVPSLAIGAILVADLLTFVLIPAAFRGGEQPLGFQVLLAQAREWNLFGLGPQGVKYVFMLGVGTMCGVVTVRLATYTGEYIRGTSAMLKEYAYLLRSGGRV